jgi:hypothetical protein
VHQNATPIVGKIGHRCDDVIRRQWTSRSPSASSSARLVRYRALDPVRGSRRGARGGARRPGPRRPCLRWLPSATDDCGDADYHNCSNGPLHESPLFTWRSVTVFPWPPPDARGGCGRSGSSPSDESRAGHCSRLGRCSRIPRKALSHLTLFVRSTTTSFRRAISSNWGVRSCRCPGTTATSDDGRVAAPRRARANGLASARDDRGAPEGRDGAVLRCRRLDRAGGVG